MTKEFTAAYLRGLEGLINRLPPQTEAFAAQSAMRLLVGQFAATADNPGDLSALRDGLATTIDLLKKFESNLAECDKAAKIGGHIVTPDNVLRILADSLRPVPAVVTIPMLGEGSAGIGGFHRTPKGRIVLSALTNSGGPALDGGTEQVQGEGAVVIGGFYQTPEGRIAEVLSRERLYGFLIYSYDDDLGPHVVSADELATWTYRPELTDFPHARDPKLPSEFVQQWGIKHRSELGLYLRNCDFHTGEDIREALTKHDIPDPTLQSVPPKRRYIILKGGRHV